MSKKLLFSICVCGVIHLHAKEFISGGHSYSIMEEELLTNLEFAPDKGNSFVKANMKEIQTIGTAKQNRSFLVHTSYTAPENILDVEGNLIVKKGKTVNPLNGIVISTQLLFIDGTDSQQVN